MKFKSLVYILSFLLTFGMAVSFVHSEPETAPETQKTETKETETQKTETKQTKSYEDLTDDEKKKVDKTVYEVLEKLKKGLEELTEDQLLDEKTLKENITKAFKNLENIDDVKVQVSTSVDVSEIITNPVELQEFVEKIKELTKDESLDDEVLEKKITELVKNLDLHSTYDIDENNVKVITSEPLVITKVYNNEDNLTGLMKKITELTKDENLNEDQLDEKLKKLLKDTKLVHFVVSDDDNVKVVVASDTKKTKGLSVFSKKLAKNIAELAKNEELDEDQLAEKIIELVKDNPTDLLSGIDLVGEIADTKVLKKGSILSPKLSNESAAIKKLTKRVETLEKKIDALIEKLDKINSK